MRDDGSDIELKTQAGDVAVTLGAPGRHMVHNALAAAAAALSAHVPLPSIARGLADFRALAGRLAVLAGIRGVRVIDDSYNANPDSVRAAIDVLAQAPATRWLVLGDMGEVGAQGPAFHREVGEYARTAGVDRLLAVGTSAQATAQAFGRGGEHFADIDALSARIAGDVREGDTVLVKEIGRAHV